MFEQRDTRSQPFLQPEHWTIPIVRDEHGNLCFGDLCEQNETAEVQPPTEPQLTGGVDLSHELHMDLPPVHVSQSQAIRIPLTDEDIESVSADLYHSVYTLKRIDEVNESQEVATNTDMGSIDTDLETLLACGDLGPLSVDDINIDGTEMEIFLTDTPQVRNALMTFDKHRLNTSDAGAHLQVSVDSFDSTEKYRNGDEERNKSLACPECSASDCEQSIESTQNNSGQILLQSCFFKHHFVNQTNRKPFQCDTCAKLFCTSSAYTKHRRIHTGEKPFQCDICPKQFRTSSNYQEHRRTHTGEKLFKCEICLKKFYTSSDCTKHRRIHTGEKPFQCDICPKQFRTSSNYQEHRRIHIGEKPFKCEICKKQFCTSSDYTKHRRIHTGEKPFQCDICPKQFRTSSNYQEHRRIHSDAKPFQCDICAKQFRISGNYQRHLRIHTGEKPFQCDICPKQFRTSSDYQAHRRIHTGEKPFQCDVCPKLFRTSSDYQRHRRTHAVDESYICYWCNQDYSSKRSLIKHVKRCSSRNSSYTANPMVPFFISSDKRKWTYMQ